MSDKLQEILRNVLDDDELIITDETTAEDVEGWDSLAHVTLMFSIEQTYGIQFNGEEFSSLENVGKLRCLIEKKVLRSESG